MPKPRLDDANIEFEFSLEESLAARSLDPNKIAWLQTKYAKLWKLRNSISAPEDPMLDRSYFLKVAEIDGKMNMIIEILDDHKAAMVEIRTLGTTGQTLATATSDKSVADRASGQVHKIPTNF